MNFDVPLKKKPLKMPPIKKNKSGESSAIILIVDDIPENLRVLSEMLRQRGYSTRPVRSGKLALRAMAIELPDLILLDINLPVMNGYEVCQAIKADPRSEGNPGHLYQHICRNCG